MATKRRHLHPCEEGWVYGGSSGKAARDFSCLPGITLCLQATTLGRTWIAREFPRVRKQRGLSGRFIAAPACLDNPRSGATGARPAGWQLTDDIELAPEVNTTVGRGPNPSGTEEAFIATIPEPGACLLTSLGLIAVAVGVSRKS